MAPLRSHTFELLKERASERKISYWYGGRSLRELFYVDEFRELEEKHPNFKFHIALSDPQPEDNWSGYTGFIHQVLLDEYLANHPAPEDCEYYICGPAHDAAGCTRYARQSRSRTRTNRLRRFRWLKRHVALLCRRTMSSRH